MTVYTAVAGAKITAAGTNDMAQVGQRVVRVTATVDSSTWNSVTKVLANLTATFTPVNGAVYAVRGVCRVGGSGAASGGLLIVQKDNSSTNLTTDTIIGAMISSVGFVAGASSAFVVEGEFTATSTNTNAVSIVGWNPTGDTATVGLKAAAGSSINSLIVTRVG